MDIIRSPRPPWPWDARLSFTARGLLAWLLHVAEHGGETDLDLVGVSQAVAELEAFGYLRRSHGELEVDEWGKL